VTTIRDTLNALTVVQAGLSVEQPRPSKVARAYPYSPPQSVSLAASLPCFTNSWDLQPVDRISVGRWRNYSIHMQLYAGQATAGDDSAVADLATAYEDAIQQALGQRNTDGLGGLFLYGDVGGAIVPTVNRHQLRGGQPTLAILERGGQSYIGLDLFLDVQVHDVMMHS